MFQANVSNNISFYIFFLDDIKCNGTEEHTAIVGEKLTYACSFKYKGVLSKVSLRWFDAQDVILRFEEHIISKYINWNRSNRGE